MSSRTIVASWFLRLTSRKSKRKHRTSLLFPKSSWTTTQWSGLKKLYFSDTTSKWTCSTIRMEGNGWSNLRMQKKNSPSKKSKRKIWLNRLTPPLRPQTLIRKLTIKLSTFLSKILSATICENVRRWWSNKKALAKFSRPRESHCKSQLQSCKKITKSTHLRFLSRFSRLTIKVVNNFCWLSFKYFCHWSLKRLSKLSTNHTSNCSSKYITIGRKNVLKRISFCCLLCTFSGLILTFWMQGFISCFKNFSVTCIQKTSKAIWGYRYSKRTIRLSKAPIPSTYLQSSSFIVSFARNFSLLTFTWRWEILCSTMLSQTKLLAISKAKFYKNLASISKESAQSIFLFSRSSLLRKAKWSKFRFLIKIWFGMSNHTGK